MRHFASAVLACFLTCANVAAQPAPSDPTGRNEIGEDDLDFALSELCFPFLLRNADPAELTARQGVSQLSARGDRTGAPTFVVRRPAVQIQFGVGEGDRSCTIRLDDARSGISIAIYREMLDARMAQWPTALALADYQYPLNGYARRELLCSPVGGPNDTLLISAGGGGYNPDRPSRTWLTPAMSITLSRDTTRSAHCDAPPGAAAVDPPVAATDPASAELQAFALLDGLCRRAAAAPETFGFELAQRNAERMGSGSIWRLPGQAQLFVGGGPDDCFVYALNADPAVLRLTMNERIASIPGVSRAAPAPERAGRPYSMFDHWCLRDERGLFGIELRTELLRADGIDGVIRFRRLSENNTVAPREPRPGGSFQAWCPRSD